MFYQRCRLEGPVSPKEAEARIRGMTAIEVPFWKFQRRIDGSRTPFRGKVRDLSFTLEKVGDSRERVMLHGTILPTPAGSAAEITMFLSPTNAVVLVSLSFFAALFIVMATPVAEYPWIAHHPYYLSLIPAWGFTLALFCALFLPEFRAEASEAERLLKIALGNRGAS